jgi:hypothetical protein
MRKKWINMKINHFFIFCSFAFFNFSSLVFCESVLIMTHSFNRPDFIEIQDKTFKKFLKDDYIFVVFNDAPQEEVSNHIIETCNRLNLTCIRIPQSIHDTPYLKREPGEDYHHPAVRCANVVQFSLDILGFDHHGLVMIIDSDMFLVKEFCAQEFLNGFDIAGVPQSRQHVEYIWNGLVFLNMQTLPDKKTINFNCGKVDGIAVDVGGQTYRYFKNHPQVMIQLVDNQHYPSDFSLSETTHEHIKFLFSHHCTNFEFLLKNSFFHYRGGGNWDNQSKEYHENKTVVLSAFIEKCLKRAQLTEKSYIS